MGKNCVLPENSEILFFTMPVEFESKFTASKKFVLVNSEWSVFRI